MYYLPLARISISTGKWQRPSSIEEKVCTYNLKLVGNSIWINPDPNVPPEVKFIKFNFIF
jgi:hypothetical protein